MATAELVQRFTSARMRASELTEQSHALTEAAKQAFETAKQTFEAALRLKNETERPRLRSRHCSQNWTGAQVEATKHLRTFELEGLIGDVPVKAAALDGVLVCDPLLRAHAEVVVAMGESLPDGRFGRSERARLDGPPAVMLATLMRAMTVTKVRVGFASGGVSDV